MKHWLLLTTMLIGCALQPSLAFAEKVGVTAAVNPQATGQPPAAEQRTLHVGIDMQTDERVVTSAGGQVQLLFMDGSGMTVGPNSDLKIDKFVYDPEKKVGDLAFNASKGVFRFVGGKISKNSTVEIKTPSGNIGIRGGVASVSVTPNGAMTATFLFGDRMTVSNNGQQIEVQRPGTAVDVTPGEPPSPPRRASASELKETGQKLSASSTDGKSSDSNAESGQGSAQSQGRADAQGIENRVVETGLTDGNSKIEPKTIVTVAAPGPITTVKPVDPIELISKTITNIQTNATSDGPAPYTLSFSGRYLGYTGNIDADPDKEPYTTPTPAGFGYTVSPYAALNAGLGSGYVDGMQIKFDVNGNSFLFPYLISSSPYSLTDANSDYWPGGYNLQGTGYVPSSDFFIFGGDIRRNLADEHTSGPQDNAGFVLFGGTPTAAGSFPTSGVALHKVINPFNDELPFVNDDWVTASASPYLYSRYSPNLIATQRPVSTERPVNLFGLVAINGSGASQKSAMVGMVGTYMKQNATQVGLFGKVLGSTRDHTYAYAEHFASAVSSAETTSSSGSAIYGATGEYMVLNPDSMFMTGDYMTRQAAAGIEIDVQDTNYNSANLESVNQSDDYFIQVASRTATASSYGTRTPHNLLYLHGYAAGMVDYFENSSGNRTVTAAASNGLIGIRTYAQNYVNAYMTMLAGATTYNLNFGDDPATPMDANIQTSAYINDDIFGARQSHGTNVSFTGATSAGSNLFMVTNAATGLTSIDGVPLCDCGYLKWGWWGGEITDTVAPGDIDRRSIHLATWVAGDLPAMGDMPTDGRTATYTGHVIGNVNAGYQQYVAAGQFQHTWTFGATGSGSLSITGFDGRNFTGTASAPSLVDFNGTINVTDGISGNYSGSFYKGGGDPAAAMGGKFQLNKVGYEAVGTFAAKK